jgi:hypothetical protein
MKTGQLKMKTGLYFLCRWTVIVGPSDQVLETKTYFSIEDVSTLFELRT